MDEVKEKLEEGKKSCPAKRDLTKEEIEEKKKSEKKGVLFLAIFGAAIALLFLGLIFLPDILDQHSTGDSHYMYNGFEFTEVDGTWYTKGYRDNNEMIISLRNGPRELEGIPVSGNFAGFRDAADFYYITFDPRDENHDKFVTMSMAEVATNFRTHFGKDFEAACTVEHPDCQETNTSVLTCDDTDTPVIYLKREPGAKVEISGNCAIIQGEGNEMVMAANRFLYGLYGIM